VVTVTRALGGEKGRGGKLSWTSDGGEREDARETEAEVEREEAGDDVERGREERKHGEGLLLHGSN
jgi:hypothetical protein